MDKLEQFYSAVGANASDVIARLGGMPALVERFLGKFRADESFHKLKADLESGETKEAFREAHTLKGLCANLGIQRLFEKASATTELLRADDLEQARLTLPDLEEEYKLVLEELKKLGIG